MLLTRRMALTAIAAIATLGAAPACSDSRVDLQNVGAAEVKAGMADGSVTLVDVREPDEWAAGHVEGSILLPLSRFDPAKLPAAQPGKKIVVICRSGNRSQTAIAAAQKAGRSDIRLNFDGGIKAWASAGGRVVR
jgi:rhodanese-related sulfurtransferase